MKIESSAEAAHSMQDVFTEASIREAIKTAWAGQEIRFLDIVGSTNEEASRQAGQGAAHGILIVAGEQTAGRGRMGRVFSSPRQEGIWMSLLIKDDIAPVNASMLTLVMGLAAARAIERCCDLTPMIKWPNDLILSGKKVCGILTEMRMQGDRISHLVIGIGINVHNAAFPETIESVATSVFLESGKQVDRNVLIAEVLQAFEQYYAVFMEHQDLSGLMNTYNKYLINRGRQVRVLAPGKSYEGVALGINAKGELLVETENDVHPVASGEVSVRGVLGYV